MKPKYFLFSKSIFRIAIWTMMFIIYLLILINKFYQIIQDWKSIIFTFIYLIFLLISMPLPIIKIDNKGITAIKLFGKRKILWKEIKNLKFIDANPFKGLSYKETSFNVDSKKRSSTIYIYISKSDELKYFKIMNLSHFGFKDITNKTDIAFEYDEKAWNLIKENISNS